MPGHKPITEAELSPTPRRPTLKTVLRTYGVTPNMLDVLSRIARGEDPRIGASLNERRSFQYTITHLRVKRVGLRRPFLEDSGPLRLTEHGRRFLALVESYKDAPLDRCCNGCEDPPCPPSLVLCKTCLEKLDAKIRSLVGES